MPGKIHSLRVGHSSERLESHDVIELNDSDLQGAKSLINDHVDELRCLLPGILLRKARNSEHRSEPQAELSAAAAQRDND